jgi:DNA-binding NarL/FixJ family response regulator
MHIQIITPSDLLARGIAAALPDARTTRHTAFPPFPAALRLVHDTGDRVPPSSGRWLAFGTHTQPVRLAALLDAGSHGYLYLGDPLAARLPYIVADVLAGGTYLSPSASAAYRAHQFTAAEALPRLTDYQRQVLHLMHRGHSAGVIAARLARSRNAVYLVQRHLRALFAVETNRELLEASAAHHLDSDW